MESVTNKRNFQMREVQEGRNITAMLFHMFACSLHDAS